MTYQKGGQHTVDVDGYQLVLKPLPLGRLEKLLNIVVEVLGQIGSMNTGDGESKRNTGIEIMKRMPTLLMENFDRVFPIIVDTQKHEFVTEGWVKNHISLPVMEEILEATYHINGVSDFLGRLKNGFKAPEPVEPRADSPSPGSSTSSGSPTDGGPGKPSA